MPENLPQLPANYPQDFVCEISLKNGIPVTLRPIRPDDARRLQEGFARLSPESIYMRFFEALKELSDAQAVKLANVDYQDHMAMVAEIQDEGKTRLIGVARYALIGPQRPGIAECAVIIADEYQGFGLATALMRQLILYARTRGVVAFAGSIHYTNANVMRFIRNSGLPYKKEMTDPGVWEIAIDIR